MPDIAELHPLSVDTDIERRKRAAYQQASARDIGTAAIGQTATSALLEIGAGLTYTPDPDFHIDEKMFNQLTDGIDPTYWPNFSGAVSYEHAAFIRAQAQARTGYRDVLATAGVSGKAATILAGLADPPTLLAGIASGGLAEAGAVGKVGLLARAGMLTGASMAALEAAKQSVDPNITDQDVLIAGLAGGVGAAAGVGSAGFGRAGRFVGAGAGAAAVPAVFDTLNERDRGDILMNALPQFFINGAMAALSPTAKRMNTEVDAAARRGVKASEWQAVIDTSKEAGIMEPFSPKGEAYLSDATKPGVPPEIAHDILIDPIANDPAVIHSAPTEVPPSESGGPAMGAASPSDPGFAKPVEAPAKQIGDLDLSSVTDESPRWSALRFDETARVGSSMSPDVARMGNMLGRDDVPRTSGKSWFTVPDWVKRTAESMIARMYHGNDAAYEGYVDASRKAGVKAITRGEFNVEATRAYRSDNYQIDDPNLRSAIDAHNSGVRSLRKETLGIAQRHGVKGASEVQFDPNNIDRIYDRGSIDNGMSQWGHERMKRLFSEAIARGSEKVTPEQADVLAEAVLKNAAAQHESLDTARSRLFDPEQSELLANTLRDIIPNATPQQIEDFLFVTKPRGENDNVPTKLRRRIQMDESHSIQLEDGTNLSVEQFIENDITDLMRRNIRYMVGQSAMAETYRQFSTDGRVVENPTQLLKIAEEGGASKKQLSILGVMIDRALGRSTNDLDPAASQALRILRNISQVRVLSGIATGINNFAEITAAMSHAGLRVTLNEIPSLGNLFKRMADGQLEEGLPRELEMLGQGVSDAAHRVLRGVDDNGLAVQPSRMDKIDEFTRRASRFSSKASGVAAVQAAVERITGRLVTQKWYDLAKSNRTLSEKRLLELDVHPEMAKRINDQILQHGTEQRSLLGNRLAAINFDKWTDLEAGAIFRRAIQKKSSQLAFTPDESQLAPWMNSDVGRTVTQLRRFMLGSWSTKTLHDLSLHDREAFTNWSIGGLGAAMTYATWTYLYSVGRPDREQYLKDRLSTKALVEAGFSRAAFSSLVPLAADTVQAARGRSPMFAFARTSGLGNQQGPSSILLGNPTFDTLDKTTKALGVPLEKIMGYAGHAIDSSYTFDDRFTRQDFNALANGAWIPNVYGIKQILDQLSRRLPER